MSSRITARPTPKNTSGRARIARQMVASTPPRPPTSLRIRPPSPRSRPAWLPADHLHDRLAPKHVAGRSVEDDLAAIDHVQPLRDFGGGHHVGLSHEEGD